MFNLLEKFKIKKESNLTSAAILIVEDNDADRILIQRTLEKKNYAVFTAPNVEGGLSLLQRYKVDLIILDYILPGLNGLNLCKILKENKRTKNIPIIFITVVDGGCEIIQFYEAGAEVYLHKPIDSKQLLKEVEQLLVELKQEKVALE